MSNYLSHHGVKGQRWGVRRYQYEDGSLTTLGKKRNKAINTNLNNSKKIVDSSSNIAKDMKRMHESVGDMKANSKTTKDLSKMSDQELQSRVKRMNLERQYSDLTSNQVSRGRANVGSVLDVVGGTLGVASSAIAIALAIREFKKVV